MRRQDDEGFSLIELMVVVLIIAILLAIATPVFLGARTRAQDRAAQQRVRDAHIVQAIAYGDDERFIDDTTELNRIDPALTFSTQLEEIEQGNRVVVIQLDTYNLDDDTVYIGAQSNSGKCFWMRSIATAGLPRFAKNESCELPTEWFPSWD